MSPTDPLGKELGTPTTRTRAPRAAQASPLAPAIEDSDVQSRIRANMVSLRITKDGRLRVVYFDDPRSAA